MALALKSPKTRRLPVSVHRDVVSGTPVFTGTRVPVEALWNNLEAGVSLEEFLVAFPTVTRAQALAVLEFGKAATSAKVRHR